MRLQWSRLCFTCTFFFFFFYQNVKNILLHSYCIHVLCSVIVYRKGHLQHIEVQYPDHSVKPTRDYWMKPEKNVIWGFVFRYTESQPQVLPGIGKPSGHLVCALGMKPMEVVGRRGEEPGPAKWHCRPRSWWAYLSFNFYYLQAKQQPKRFKFHTLLVFFPLWKVN